MKYFTTLALAFGALAFGTWVTAAFAVEGKPCSMRFLHATVRNVGPSQITPSGCMFQIFVSDPETEAGCSLEVGEVDSQFYADSECKFAEGDDVNGYVFRNSSGTYEADLYKRN